MALSVNPNPAVTYTLRHADDDVLVIEKRSGLVTQPGKGHEDDTLLNGLFAQFGDLLQNLGKARDFGLLHRLDRETSGLLVAALRPRAYDALREMFERREIRKFYWAVCARAPKEPEGVINKPIAETEPRRLGDKKLARFAPPPLGKPAVTAYRTLAATTTGAVVEVRPLTGRLHQVRIHLDAIGSPILGDGLYAAGAVAAAAPRLALHAHRLAFRHPVTGAEVDVHTVFPRELRGVLKRLGLPRPEPAGPVVKLEGPADEPE